MNQIEKTNKAWFMSLGESQTTVWAFQDELSKTARLNIALYHARRECDHLITSPDREFRHTKKVEEGRQKWWAVWTKK
jgi:hypothetical protein